MSSRQHTLERRLRASAQAAVSAGFLVGLGGLLVCAAFPPGRLASYETDLLSAIAVTVLAALARVTIRGQGLSALAGVLGIGVLGFAIIAAVQGVGAVPALVYTVSGGSALISTVLAVALVVQALAVLLVSRCHPPRYCTGQWVSLVVMLFCVVVFVGRSYGVQLLTSAGHGPPVPLADVAGLFLVATGTALARPQYHPIALYAADDLGGYVARRLVPLTIVFPLLLGLLALWRDQLFPHHRRETIAIDVMATVLVFGTVVAYLAHRLSVLDRAARRQHAKKEAVIRSMTEGVALFDALGVLVDMNPVALMLYGYERSEVEGRTIVELAHEIELYDLAGAPVPVAHWPVARALRGEVFQGCELQSTRRNGQLWTASYGGAPVRDSDGSVALAVITFRDVTAVRETERKLAEAHRALEHHAHELEETVARRTENLTETVHELERFSYSLSHDLRAPLRAMRGYAQILESGYGAALGAEGTGYVQRIAAAAGRLDQLIQDVLSYSLIVRHTITLAPVDLDALLAQLFDEQPALRSSDVTVRRPLGRVLGHEAYLTQVLSHLLYNAVKFVPRGEMPRVEIWSEQGDDLVRIIVRDYGIGISADDQKRLFGMFQRLNTEYEGTGIGLSIVRKAVQRMGGRVGVESERGRGTTFWLELAAAEDA